MRRYLVVAHKTLAGEHLLEHVRKVAAGEPSEFHLLVPASHPSDHAWTDGSVEAAAKVRLEEGLERFREAGIEATGEVGDANPVYAITTVLRREVFDEVILSTLPAGPSRWLKWDVPSRVRNEVGIPVTHLVAERERRARE